MLGVGLSFGLVGEPSFLVLILCQLALGIGWNWCYVSSTSWLTKNFPPTQRSPEHGAYDFCSSMGMSVGIFSSAPLYAALGFSMLGLVNLTLDLVVGIII